METVSVIVVVLDIQEREPFFFSLIIVIKTMY